LKLIASLFAIENFNHFYKISSSNGEGIERYFRFFI